MLRKLARFQIAALWVPEHHSGTLPARFVPSSSLPAWGARKEPDLKGLLDTTHVLANVDTRSKAEWAEARTTMARPDIHLDVDDGADPLTDAELVHLQDAALRIPYVGRASHAADVVVARVGGDAPSDEHHRWKASPDRALRGWDEHTLDVLDRVHAAVFIDRVPASTPASRARAVDVPQPAGHRRLRVQATARFSRKVDVAEIPYLLQDVRDRAALQAWGGSLTPRVVALPDVGHPRATGRVLGVGFVSDDEAAALRMWGLLGDVLDPTPPQRTVTLFARRWDTPWTSWYSATPFVGHPDMRIAELELRRDLGAWAGNEIAADVTLSRQPLAPGQVTWPDPGTGAVTWWAAITTGEEIPGPLVLGARIDRGYGLFARGDR
ncbi:hypothetical protein Xcel_2873 [Xylanimonas cellulosilytica DSM 15894]|uniref:CRISPR-associated protein Csb2 n=1 Tax=Xylanimonas cellulosilytica (strain DSM 15894 / JCM 12276 / CECT 5975 / KCTC 9989 / LMG 20990 / NBRC 107835 / XIL07) TaxID=446471 RepID=D1BYL4_XYLCX|nr:hypothetical protein Xcel_2873 [Xylanimonas cellulosilytica DSM 15894]